MTESVRRSLCTKHLVSDNQPGPAQWPPHGALGRCPRPQQRARGAGPGGGTLTPHNHLGKEEKKKNSNVKGDMSEKGEPLEMSGEVSEKALLRPQNTAWPVPASPGVWPAVRMRLPVSVAHAGAEKCEMYACLYIHREE